MYKNSLVAKESITTQKWFLQPVFFVWNTFWEIDGLVQDCSNSIANALKLLQSCAKTSRYLMTFVKPEQIIPVALQWRHNERDGVSNQRCLGGLLNRLFRRRWKKTQSSASPPFVRGIHRWPVNSPHKGPVTRKCFHLMTSSWCRKYSYLNADRWPLSIAHK